MSFERNLGLKDNKSLLMELRDDFLMELRDDFLKDIH
jgi:hypothetical protein